MVELLLIQYTNTNGKTADGLSCDPWPFGDCETAIHLCVRNGPAGNCAEFGGWLNLTSSELGGVEDVVFGMKPFPLTPASSRCNPLSFPFGSPWNVSDQHGFLACKCYSKIYHNALICYYQGGAKLVVKIDTYTYALVVFTKYLGASCEAVFFKYFITWTGNKLEDR